MLIMLDQATRFDGREAVLAVAGDDPFVRLHTPDTAATGFGNGQTAAWIAVQPWGPTGFAAGDPGQALGIFVDPTGWSTSRRDHPWLPERTAGLRVNLPRVHGALPDVGLRLTRRDDWEFRWTLTPPPAVPGEDRVVRLTERHHAAIDALLDDALPGTLSRPGFSGVRDWYGIFDDGQLVAPGDGSEFVAPGDAGQLVACGADRSRADVGFLASLAVGTRYRRRGLGAALTAAMTRRLFTEYAVVALGVVWDNAPAIRLYQRLGFTQILERTSVTINPQ